MTLQSHSKRLEIEIDNYQQTVLSLRALANEVLFDESTKSLRAQGSAHCGRRFRTSDCNRHAPSTDVHPDLTILQTPSYGVVAEAKLGFDSDAHGFDRRINETVEQLEKYDDDLMGWPGCSGDEMASFVHDLTLIVNFEDARRAVRKLEELIAGKQLKLARNLAIISIARLGRSGGEWPTLALEYGSLSDEDKTIKLDSRIPIKPEILDASPLFGQVCLCDHEPPLPLMMHLVHQAIVSNLTNDESEKYNLEGQGDKEVLLDQLQGWLRPYAFKKVDKRDPVIPKMEWIKRALKSLVDMEWVSRNGKSDCFTFHHKKGRKGCTNPLGRFTEVYAKHLIEVEKKQQRQKAREDRQKAKQREILKRKNPLFASQIDNEYDGLPVNDETKNHMGGGSTMEP
jgi:hypothetical protein